MIGFYPRFSSFISIKILCSLEALTKVHNCVGISFIVIEIVYNHMGFLTLGVIELDNIFDIIFYERYMQ